MENLAIGLCSECSKVFRYDTKNKKYFCSCGWSMTKEEFQYLMSVREKNRWDYHTAEYEENLSELNNLKL